MQATETDSFVVVATFFLLLLLLLLLQTNSDIVLGAVDNSTYFVDDRYQ